MIHYDKDAVNSIKIDP